MDHQEAAYWEGYYLMRGSPLHHAWVVMSDNRVVDFTLEATLRKVKRMPKLTAIYDRAIPLYFGFHVPSSYLRQKHKTENFGKPLVEQYLSESNQKSPLIAARQR